MPAYCRTRRTLQAYPWIEDLPIIGTLFRSTAFQRGETELVILVTPYIVKPVSATALKTDNDGFYAPSDKDRVMGGNLNTVPTQADPAAKPAAAAAAPNATADGGVPSPAPRAPVSSPVALPAPATPAPNSNVAAKPATEPAPSSRANVDAQATQSPPPVATIEAKQQPPRRPRSHRRGLPPPLPALRSIRNG